MSYEFFHCMQDEEMKRAVLETLGAEDQLLVQLAGDLRISGLTEGAHTVLCANVFQPIQELLSEQTCVALRICLKETCGAQLREALDGISYALAVRPAGGGLLLHFIPLEWQSDDRPALAHLIEQRTRTYVSSMLALLSHMDREKDQAARRQLLKTLRRYALRIARTQDHAVLLKRLQREYEPDLQMQDAAEMCRELVRRLPEGRVAVRVQAPAHCTAVYDGGLLRLALGGLLTNAVAVARREVTLSLWHLGRRLTFGVTDDGRGLSAQELGRLCTNWRRRPSEEKWRETAEQGMGWGLGLPIAEQVAGLHGGVLLAHPNKEHGVRMLLSIPDDLEALHLLRQPDLVFTSGIDELEIEYSVL